MLFGNVPSTALTDIVISNGIYYLVDSRLTFDHGYETMAFFCDPEGNVTNWTDVYANWYSSLTEMQRFHKKIVANPSEYF